MAMGGDDVTRYTSRRQSRYPREESSFSKGVGWTSGAGCGCIIVCVAILGLTALLASL